MIALARLAAVLAAAAVVSLAQAYTIEYRVVERIGTTDHVLPSAISIRPGTAHRYRIQVRVVPDGPTDALAGFIGWVPGTITTTGGINTRTGQSPNPNPRGRLSPFTFANSAASEGFPNVDPFTSLTNIDAAIGIRTASWECGPDGQPLPQPVPAPLGRGDFVSLYEITSVATSPTYTITFAGNLVAGMRFVPVNCSPPDCGDSGNPDDDMPSTCQFGPLAFPPQSFSLQLTIHACRGEWNNDYVVNSQDIFDFFTDFFAGNADINNDGTTNSDDYFQFIIGFVSGCI